MRWCQSVISCVVLILVFGSCGTKNNVNSPEPADTKNTIWHTVVSGNVPDTIQYGINATFQIAAGDSDGDSVSAVVTGIPAQRYHITFNGDTTFVMFTIAADSLQFDSLYTIGIHVSGIDSVDTATFRYNLMVLDTNRLGGIRKLVTGMWWTNERFDTIVTVKDSLNTQFTTRDTSVHHLYSTVLGSYGFQGATYWAIATFDTNITKGSSVKYDTTYLQHLPTAVQVLSLPKDWFDTVRVEYYKLPLAVGSSWSMVDDSSGTMVTSNWDGIKVRLNMAYALKGTASATAIENTLFGGVSRKCYSIVSGPNYNVSAISDTTIVIATVPVISKGDTAVTWSVSGSSRQLLCDDLGIALSSNGLQVTRQTNKLTKVVQSDSTRTASSVTRLYDPRRGSVIVR